MTTAPVTADFDTDVAIIGSGFGGSVAALRLSEKGYRVTVLEKGKRWRPEDFPTTNWNIPKSFWMPRLGCHGTWGLQLFRDVLVLHGVGRRRRQPDATPTATSRPTTRCGTTRAGASSRTGGA